MRIKRISLYAFLLFLRILWALLLSLHRPLKRLRLTFFFLGGLLLIGCRISPYEVATVSLKGGIGPFIREIELEIPPVQWTNLTSLSFSITPKEGAVSRPIKATFSKSAIEERGYYVDEKILLPIFGLYEEYPNQVLLEWNYQNRKEVSQTVEVLTERYVDPRDWSYNRPEITKNYPAEFEPPFSYFLAKTNRGPHIYDIDGNLRWHARFALKEDVTSETPHPSEILVKNTVVFYDATPNFFTQVELDGRFQRVENGVPHSLHHDITEGKEGTILIESGPRSGNIVYALEETDSGFRWDGSSSTSWNLDEILTKHIDEYNAENAITDPRQRSDKFVTNKNYIHQNSLIYSPEEDSILVSSRQAFVISIDYSSQKINWIMGDETKYWHTFEALRSLSLTLLLESNPKYTVDQTNLEESKYVGKSIPPIGQHSLNWDFEGNLLLFNNGKESTFDPTLPEGTILKESYLQRFRLDIKEKKAFEIQRIDKNLWSEKTSAVEERGGYLLAHYSGNSKPDNSPYPEDAAIRIFILESTGSNQELLEMTFENALGRSSWSYMFNSDIIDLTDLQYR